MNKISLLVIEDDLIDQKVIKKAINDSFIDAEYEFFTSLDEIPTNKLHRFDLVLTDYNLPGQNGVQILKYLKEECNVTAPIVVMTGVSDDAVGTEALTAGAFDFLTKDLITPEGIGLVVRSAIRITKEKNKADLLLKKLRKHEIELIKAKNKAENEAKLKQEFLANMSHEIRTPMNAILGFTEIVMKEQLNEDIKEKVSRIQSAGNNLLVIINDILDLSKIEAGQLEIEAVRFDIHKCLDQVKFQFENTAKRKNLRLIFSIDESIPKMVLGDSVRLNQILLNLINNAIKFTEKGFVEVRARVIKESKDRIIIQFEVEDTGIGISQDKQAAMFESFTQASSDTTRKYGGTGLGLAICKSLVELQNGKIWIESEEGIGSQFKFTIEYGTCSQKEEEVEDVVDVECIDISGTKLLLVEDNQMNRELAIHFFKQWDLNYDTAENGAIALEKIQQEDYQIVLMDISMPVMDGYTATREIRGLQGDKKNTPIVAMTANAFSNDIEKCLEAGMNDHIAKPFNSADLKQKIFNLSATVKKSKKILNPKTKKNVKKVVKKDNKTAEKQLISLNILKEMSGNNKEFMKDMLGIFINETPVTLNRIKNALKNDDPEELKAAAHKFRSPAGLMGISEIVSLAEFVELNVFNKEKRAEVESAVEEIIILGEKAIDETKNVAL